MLGQGLGLNKQKAPGGVSFIPTDITGLNFWFDPANGVTKDGSNNVTAVADQSANGIALDGTGHTPLWVDNEINGNPIIRFNGSTSYLIDNTSAKSKYNFLHEQDTTFFAVVKFNEANPGTRQTLFDTNGLGALKGYNVTFDDNAINNGAAAFVGNGSAWIILDRTADTLTPQQWFIWSIKTDLDNVTASQRCQQRIDGSNIAQANAETAAVVVGDSSRFFAIGARNSGTNDLANVDVAEILIYNAALTPTEVGQVESYLSTKYF